ncbi:MAG: signal recognition particle-docking protein FtsY [Bacilli bacterium]|jgi:fused signal recognition particle receptor|nr:signal recognition particle-docking protein FtsY [Bacilli bacterium]
MGLIDYLKKKFGKNKSENEVKEEQTTTNDSQKVASLENSNVKPENNNSTAVVSNVEKPVESADGKQKENQESYVRGMQKAHHGFMYRLKSLASIFHKVNDEYFDDLEEILIEADVGADLTFKIIDEAKKEAKIEKIDAPEEINKLVIEKMFEGYQSAGNKVDADLAFVKEGPTVLLIVGVNGGGKTTTIAKLSKRYKDAGKKILLVAADTFRAGAVEQLGVWAQRIGVDILTGPEGSDPSSLCYDGLTKAVKEKYDLVIVDTAGRLQNKVNLMNELAKMRRVMTKVIPSAPHESFLIIDANTGQNGIEQAQVFKEATPLTGIVITKMDGTSKGGIILAIRDKLGIPVRFIGLGEGMDDLKEFDLDDYLYGLLVGEGD